MSSILPQYSRKYWVVLSLNTTQYYKGQLGDAIPARLRGRGTRTNEVNAFVTIRYQVVLLVACAVPLRPHVEASNLAYIPCITSRAGIGGSKSSSY